jgi:hypothetical protein
MRPLATILLPAYLTLTGTGIAPAQIFPPKNPPATPGGPVISGQTPAPAPAQPTPAESPALGALKETPREKLTEQTRTRLGQIALAIRPADWKHAETPNFIYHYFNSFIATPVSVEAEFYYRVIAKDLGKDTSKWERKCHIYIFEENQDWRAFQKAGQLDPWTGGLHSQNELFIQRNPAFKWKGHLLGHETAHLVLDRFYGSAGIPLWLNEGYAEYIGEVAYSAYYRARGYTAKPTSAPLAPADLLPLATLTGMAGYPPEPQVRAFYTQSEKLVRYLTGQGDAKFNTFMDQMGQGRRLENALSAAYGNTMTLSKLEADFKVYATKDYNPANANIRAGQK